LNRVFGDAANAPNPQRGLAQMMFGLSSLSGVLLGEFAQVTGRSRREVLHGVDVRYLNAPRPGPNPAQPAPLPRGLDRVSSVVSYKSFKAI
jgi:hypothetical protein